MNLDIELIGIETVIWPESRLGNPTPSPHWKVTIAIPQRNGDNLLQATWYLPKKSWPDGSVLPVARNWFHRLCKDAAENTSDWLLSDAQFEVLKRPQPTPLSSGTGETLKDPMEKPGQ